ncbi:MAG: zinc ribbon domain-containing protein [Chloroflexi bacterium]|nr:zinc ribbon domain-containing protein [Chloroflexota bacterium]
MDISSILFILALLILVILYILQPFATRRSLVVSSAEKQFSVLLAERERILGALEELDFDHSMGKVPEENYPAQRARLVEAGTEVLRKLDIHKKTDVDLSSKDQGAKKQNDKLETMIAARRKTRPEKRAAFCHNCGTRAQPDDQFCANCGVKLT